MHILKRLAEVAVGRSAELVYLDRGQEMGLDDHGCRVVAGFSCAPVEPALQKFWL